MRKWVDNPILGGLSCYTGWVIILIGWVIILNAADNLILGWLSSYIGWVIILNAVDNLTLGGLSSYTGCVLLFSSASLGINSNPLSRKLLPSFSSKALVPSISFEVCLLPMETWTNDPSD